MSHSWSGTVAIMSMPGRVKVYPLNGSPRTTADPKSRWGNREATKLGIYTYGLQFDVIYSSGV